MRAQGSHKCGALPRRFHAKTRFHEMFPVCGLDDWTFDLFCSGLKQSARYNFGKMVPGASFAQSWHLANGNDR